MSATAITAITPQQAETLDGLFRARVAATPTAIAYCEYDRRSARWQRSSWAEMGHRVARWQRALASEGLNPGDRVAVALRNGRDWVCFDQAAAGLGLVTVPLYVDDRPDNLRHIVDDAAVRLLLLQDDGRWRRLEAALSDAPSLQRVLLLEDGNGSAASDGRLRAVAEWLPEGGGELAVSAASGDELATLVYTSGTTGRSKGVMLSHRNLLENAHAGLSRFPLEEDDSMLSFLPLAHTLERTAGYYLPMMAGLCVSYARSVQQLAEDLQTLRPTLLVAVPRIFESVHARIEQGLATKGRLARWLFAATVSVGWRRFERQQRRAGWSWQLLAWPLLKRLVAAPVQARLGGRVRYAISGGAPLSAALARQFIALGIPIYQGYGLTETSPVVSVNTPMDNRPATVGRPLPGVSVQLGEEGELLIRGASVCLGYWHLPEASAALIDRSGWLHSGDQAVLEDGFIRITGRLKDILVLSNGEKVPPADMELAITLDPLFEQALVVGEGRSYLTLLAVVAEAPWQALATELGLDATDPTTLHDRRVERIALQRVAAALAAFPSYAKVRRITLLTTPWSIDNGMMTPTMKLKRGPILAHQAAAVAAMYGS